MIRRTLYRDLDLDNLEAARLEVNLSRQEFARRVGVTPMTTYLWEKGVFRPRPEYLPKIYDVLNQAKSEADQVG